MGFRGGFAVDSGVTLVTLGAKRPARSCPVLIAVCKRGSGHGQMKASYLPVCVRPSGNVTFNEGFAFHKTARLRAWRPVSPAPIPTARGYHHDQCSEQHGCRHGCRQIRVAGKSDALQASGMPRCCRQIRVAGKSGAPRGCRQIWVAGKSDTPHPPCTPVDSSREYVGQEGPSARPRPGSQDLFSPPGGVVVLYNNICLFREPNYPTCFFYIENKDPGPKKDPGSGT